MYVLALWMLSCHGRVKGMSNYRLRPLNRILCTPFAPLAGQLASEGGLEFAYRSRLDFRAAVTYQS